MPNPSEASGALPPPQSVGRVERHAVAEHRGNRRRHGAGALCGQRDGHWSRVQVVIDANIALRNPGSYRSHLKIGVGHGIAA